MSTARVAIIGAGIAGLAAGRRLTDGGVEVVLFDKARRPGGRISTRRADALSFDHGAQYFTCRDPVFEGHVGDWCDRGVAARWEERFAVLEAGRCSIRANDAPRYVGVPSMSAIARDLESGLHIVCERRIERVEPTGRHWRLVSEDGRSTDAFAAVLIATPAPQAVPLLAALPALAERVAEVEMQPCHAAMVAFDEPLDVSFGGANVEDAALSWVARNASKPERGEGECWVLHSTTEWSRAHLDDPPDVVAANLLAAFGNALGKPLPPTTHRGAHRWLLARPVQGLGRPFLWDPDARIGLCGDWCIEGRIEAAFSSGDRLAREVLGESLEAEAISAPAQGIVPHRS